TPAPPPTAAPPAKAAAGAPPTAPAPPATPELAFAPPAGDRALRQDGDVGEAWIDGMQVLVKRIPGAELVATQLYIRGRVRNWSAADAGVEQLALATAT